jgi:hypothetical protein
VSWLSYSSLTPPNLFVLLGTVGLVMAWWKRWLGLALAATSVGCLYLVSTPVVAHLLIRSSEAIVSAVPTLPSNSPPGAIIVLAADAQRGDTPGEPDIVGPLTLGASPKLRDSSGVSDCPFWLAVASWMLAKPPWPR